MGILQDNADSKSQNETNRTLRDQNIRKSILAVKYKFLVMSCQEGVGKTSVVVNLAVTLSKKGLKVGLLDFDFHNPNIHRMLGLERPLAWDPDQLYRPMPYSDDLKVAMIEPVIRGRGTTGRRGKSPEKSGIRWFISSVKWDHMDCLLVDTPPGPGEALLTLVGVIPEAKAIIVTAPDKISENRAAEMINFFKNEKIPIFGWIENMRGFLCQQCGRRQELFSTGSGSRAVFLMDIPFLGRIPIDTYLSECVVSEEPFVEKYPDSQAAEAYDLIAEKIIEATQWKTHSDN